ncbi:MAG: chaperonin GroEL [Kiloniellales bacterium]
MADCRNHNTTGSVGQGQQRVLFDEEARRRLLAGASALTNAVKVTLGPRGRVVLLEAEHGPPRITKEGAAVAETIELSDRFANLGAEVLRQAARATEAQAGDGATTAMLLAHSVFSGGLKALAAGIDASALRQGINQAVTIALAQLVASARPAKTEKEIAAVAISVANGDRALGTLLSRATAAAGADGLVVIEEGRATDDKLKIVGGMFIERGYVSRAFVTDEQSLSVELKNPLILIYLKKIERLDLLIGVLDRVAELRRPLLIVAEDVAGEALTTLVVNRERGGVKVAAVRASGFASYRRELLEDLALATGATLVLGEPGFDLGDIGPEVLGKAAKVRITAKRTHLIGGTGDPKAIERRIALLRRLRAEAGSDDDRVLIDRRLAKLAGRTAVVGAGGYSEAAIRERKSRFEKALRAVVAARDGGLAIGGGVAYLRAARALDGLIAKNCDTQAGIALVRRALARPAYEIASNAGADGKSVVARIAASDEEAFGFDAGSLTFGDLEERGILDPLPVVAGALRQAASVATLLLSVQAAVGAKPPLKIKRHPFACKCSDHDHQHYPGDPYHARHHD